MVPPLCMASIAGRMTVLCVDPYGSVYRLRDGKWLPAKDLEVRRRLPALEDGVPPPDEDDNIPIIEAQVGASFLAPGGCSVM